MGQRIDRSNVVVEYGRCVSIIAKGAIRIINKLGFIGIIRTVVRDAETGEVVREKRFHNTDTYFFRKSVASWLAGTATTTSTPPPTQIGAGTGFGTPAASDTALWAPLSGTQRACDSISTAQQYYAQFNITYQTTDPNGAYTEVGLFDSAGNMWAHAAINEIKSSGQTLTVQWMILVASDTSNASAVITNYARSTIIGWLTGTQTTTSAPPPNSLQLGTGAGAPQITDTALWNATSGTLKSCDSIYVSGVYNVQYIHTYTSADPLANFTEVALVDASNNVWMHATLTNANKTDSRILAVLLQIAVNGN